jgi:hypothetical protein
MERGRSMTTDTLRFVCYWCFLSFLFICELFLCGVVVLTFCNGCIAWSERRVYASTSFSVLRVWLVVKVTGVDRIVRLDSVPVISTATWLDVEYLRVGRRDTRVLIAPADSCLFPVIISTSVLILLSSQAYYQVYKIKHGHKQQ